jgi:YHS domain-containing protein
VKRFFLALVVFSFAVWILRRMAGFFEGKARTGESRPQRGRARRRSEGITELVRDRICNTYLPKDRALTLSESGQIHYFCSEGCRSRHLTGASREIGAA